MPMIETRRYQRLPVKLPVTIRCQGRLIPATMLNLSCGGACVRADGIDLSSDLPVELVFDFESGQRDVSMRGRIVHTQQDSDGMPAAHAGIRFSNLFSVGHKAIQDFLRKNLN